MAIRATIECPQIIRSQNQKCQRAAPWAVASSKPWRHTRFFSNDRPQFCFRTADVTGTALEERSHFAIREGNCAVGAGIVTQIME